MPVSSPSQIIFVRAQAFFFSPFGRNREVQRPPGKPGCGATCRLYPFVLFYQPCAEEETVCVDAREYGNEARFVRRSCCPNVQVQHVVHNGLLHLYLVSSRDIAPGQELTIPFDFDYRQW